MNRDPASEYLLQFHPAAGVLIIVLANPFFGLFRGDVRRSGLTRCGAMRCSRVQGEEWDPLVARHRVVERSVRLLPVQIMGVEEHEQQDCSKSERDHGPCVPSHAVPIGGGHDW